MVIIIASLLVQLAAVVYSFKLFKVIDRITAFILTFALILMVSRRGWALYNTYFTGIIQNDSFYFYNITGLFLSLLMLMAIIKLEPIIKKYKNNEETEKK